MELETFIVFQQLFNRMALKDSFKSLNTLTRLTSRNLTIIGIFLIFLEIFNILEINRFINIELIALSTIVFGAITADYWLRQSQNLNQEKLIFSAKYLAVALWIMFSISFIQSENPESAINQIGAFKSYFLWLASALTIIVLRHDKKAINNIKFKNKEETKVYSHTNSFFGKIYGKMRAQGLINLLVLIFIIILFSSIKQPYKELSFTGVHELKYTSYLGPALSMLDNGPFWYERMDEADLFSNGIYPDFKHYPFMEWSLYGMLKIFPEQSIESNTRNLLTFIGILTLIFIYLSFTQVISKKHTLFILAMISMTYIFQLNTFVTVMDVWTLLCLFLSLYLMIMALKKDSSKILFISSIIAGIGVNLKYSAILFYVPIFLCFLIFYKKFHEPKRIFYILLFMCNLLVQTIIFRLSLRNLPSKTLVAIFMFVLFVFILIVVYKKMFWIEKKVVSFISNIGYKKTYFMLFIGLVVVVFIVLNVSWVNYFASTFLTNKHYIFNWNQYSLFLEKIKIWVTQPIYSMGIAWIIIGLFVPSKKIKLLFYSFLFGALTYFVLASKTMYHHQYYTHIIIITLTSYAYIFTQIFNKKIEKAVIILLLVALLIFVVYPANKSLIDEEFSKSLPVVKNVSMYLAESMNEDEIFILGDDVVQAVGLYAHKKSFIEIYEIRENTQTTLALKSIIDEGENLSSVMEHYSIKYYVSRVKKTSAYPGLGRLFFNEEAPYVCSNEQICSQNERLKEIGPDIFEQEIKDYMILEKQIGDHFIYRFY